MMKLEHKTLSRISVLALLAVIGFDFLLHAGLLNRFYYTGHPFLLTPEQAFNLIPVGYLAFLLLILLLIWLMLELGIRGGREGAKFGLQVGGLIWGAFTLGLISIANVQLILMAGWFIGQTLELGLAGFVIGTAFEADRLGPLAWRVVWIMAGCFVLGITLQNV
jgi:hypothetical protein